MNRNWQMEFVIWDVKRCYISQCNERTKFYDLVRFPRAGHKTMNAICHWKWNRRWWRIEREYAECHSPFHPTGSSSNSRFPINLWRRRRSASAANVRIEPKVLCSISQSSSILNKLEKYGHEFEWATLSLCAAPPTANSHGINLLCWNRQRVCGALFIYNFWFLSSAWWCLISSSLSRMSHTNRIVKWMDAPQHARPCERSFGR